MTSCSGPRIVAGFGRSGTTWIQDVLARSNNLRAVFEPLHPHLVAAAGLPLQRTGFHRTDDQNPELLSYLNKYFFGEFRSLWADYRIIGRKLRLRRGEFLSIGELRRVIGFQRQIIRNLLRYNAQRACSERITKFVRANMMLSWLKKTFDARIVYVVRHPAAVVLSQIRAPLSWKPRQAIEYYRSDSHWLSTATEQIAELMFAELTDIQAHTLHWCVEVSTALEHALECDIPVVFYEELVEQGRPEWRRILQHLDLYSMPDDELIGLPSQQAWGRNARDSSLVRRYSSWMQDADQDMIAQVQGVLDATSMSLYRVSDALPANAGAYR